MTLVSIGKDLLLEEKKDYSKMGSRYILPAPSSLGANEKP